MADAPGPASTGPASKGLARAWGRLNIWARCAVSASVAGAVFLLFGFALFKTAISRFEGQYQAEVQRALAAAVSSGTDSQELGKDAAEGTNSKVAIVLTGAAGRIPAGLDLLRNGHASHLFISGVGKDFGPQDLISRYGVEASRIACCITLGYDASNTRGNAAESASWLRAWTQEHGKTNAVYIVTSSYHMPRALFEMARSRTLAALDIALQPVPVSVHARHGPAGRGRDGVRAGFGRDVLEYLKYLRARASAPFRLVPAN